MPLVFSITMHSAKSRVSSPTGSVSCGYRQAGQGAGRGPGGPPYFGKTSGITL
jgi:hypothetical protein